MPEVDRSGCNCCTGVTVKTPVQIYNIPGLPALAYRAGTYTQFMASMQTRLSDSDLPGLQALRTRRSDDFTLALLDAWAMVSDVLTFYQERIANESYKRTATERASLLELARLVRYKLQPGIAADTYLTFTVDVTPGSPGFANINIGTQAQSLPGPGQTPQTFETTASMVAYARWNAIAPVTTQAQPIYRSTRDILLQGTSLNLKVGDAILIVTGETNPQDQFFLYHAQKVDIDAAAQQTHVFFEGYQPSSSALAQLQLRARSQAKAGAPAQPPVTVKEAFRQRPLALTDDVIRQLVLDHATRNDLEAIAAFQGWSVSDVFAILATISNGTSAGLLVRASEQPLANPQVFVLRAKASLFGYNAPAWNLMPPVIQGNYTQGKQLPPGQSAWTDWPFTAPDSKTLDLDRVYSKILNNTWIVIEQSGSARQFAQATQAQEVTRTDYGLSLRVTRLVLDRDINPPLTSLQQVRQVTVYAQAEPLALAIFPATQPITGNQVIVDGVFKDLSANQLLVVTGQPVGSSNVTKTEFVTLDHAEPLIGNQTLLQLKGDGLSNLYDPTTVAINANVLPATQGESVKNEVLGSGDATQAFQSFTLRQSPLAYVQAPTPDGKASTLSITVDGLPWQEVDTFYGHGPYERIFVTSIGDDQTVTVQFGDGSTGARLPTGEDNVIASYRTGSGSQGIVKPRQISLLKTQPLGVKGVSNPLSPTGAVDPDTIEDARRNADNTVRTLGRIVSVSDYETYAYSYAAVAKARATLIWNNQVRSVYVTIAGPPAPEHATGTIIEQGSGIYNKIYSGMRQHSDPTVPFFLLPYTTPFFRLAAQVKVRPDFAPEGVLQAVDQAVRDVFSFNARAFSQPVYLKEVIAVTQAIPGVVTIHIYAFYRRGDEPVPIPGPDNNLPEDSFLKAGLPTLREDGSIQPAELLLIDPAQPFYKLEVMP